MEGTVICPVCTLYLRPGITLKSHLESHPKQKVIDALVKLHSDVETHKDVDTAAPLPVVTTEPNQPWIPHPHPQAFITPGSGPLGNVHGPGPGAPGNHSFYYHQQFMSSLSPQSQSGYVNQPYVTVPIFNGQMGLPQYVYQQQQVFVHAGPGASLPRLLPISGAGAETNIASNIVEIHEDEGPRIVEDEAEDGPKTPMEDLVCEEEIPDPESGEINHAEDPLECAPEAETEPEVIGVEPEVEMPQLENQIELDLDEEKDKEVEMSKSCQTQTLDVLEYRQHILKPDHYEPKPPELEVSRNYITLTNPYHEAVENNADADTHNFDMDGMNLILGHEFVQSQSDFDYSQNTGSIGYKYERPRILMKLQDGQEQDIGPDFDNRDESISIDSANIRADENMPLSGQESNASDVASWSRLQYHEGSSRMSTGMSTYDLLARESWEGSDASDLDAPPPYQSRNPPFDDDLIISSTSRQGIDYKCSVCEMVFVCPKERRVHHAEVHTTSSEIDAKQTIIISGSGSGSFDDKLADKKVNVIGSQLFKKKVKKLVIKPKSLTKPPKTEQIEGPFDHIFNNILKVEDDTIANNSAKTEMGSLLGTYIPAEQPPPPPAMSTIICVLCCTVFKEHGALKQHQVDDHQFEADTKYKCGVCNEHFTAEPPYTEHLTIHPIECQLCGKYFYRGHNMQLHIRRHMGIKPFKCITCDKNFLTRSKLQEHRNVHTGEAPLKCNMCQETFKRHSNLIQHRNRHHLMLKKKLKDFICALCGDIFHSKKKLAWHKEIHDNKPKSCLHCSEKFIHASSLTRHVRRAHNERFVPEEERANENVECPICKGVYLRSSLDTHIKNHSGQKSYTCSVCDKDFTTKWNLKLHKWTHAGRAQKPFKCELCKGAFVRETDYTAHMNSHKSIRPYTCNYCGAQFIRKYNCQRHVKEHERVKTYTCTVCGKTFHRSYYLNDHMRIHSGVRPFSCHICGKTSTTKSNHNKHVRIHHAREPVSTES